MQELIKLCFDVWGRIGMIFILTFFLPILSSPGCFDTWATVVDWVDFVCFVLVESIDIGCNVSSGCFDLVHSLLDWLMFCQHQ